MIQSATKKLFKVFGLEVSRIVQNKNDASYVSSEDEKQYEEIRNFFVNEERRLTNNREQRKSNSPTISDLKRELKRVLGVEDAAGFDIHRVEVIPLDSSVQDSSGTLCSVSIRLKNSISVRGVLGLPKNEQHMRLPAVICLHGLRSRPEILFNLDKGAYVQQINKNYEKNFALTLLKKGYVVFAPYMINEFGTESKRQKLDLLGIPLGYRLVGIEVTKLLRSIDFLSEHSQVDRNRIGIYGISSGGIIALWAAVLDDRIKVTVLSNSLYDGADGQFTNRLGAKPASLVRAGKFWGVPFDYLKTFSEDTLVSMICGRYLFVEMGEDDYKTDRAVQYTQSVLERLYETGEEKFFGYEVSPGVGHEIILNKSLDFIQRNL